MIYTARQLEDMHRAVGQIVLPYRARLTPLAKDWVRAKQVAVGYSDATTEAKNSAGPQSNAGAKRLKAASLPLLWWCDAPAGSARAAVNSAAKETSLEQMAIGQDISQLRGVIKLLVGQINAKKIGGGVLVMKSPSLGLLYANRNAALRAITASTFASLDEAINAISPNVLVIEHTQLTVQQIKNMILRFGRSAPAPKESLQSELKEVAQCG
jgi:hypothetical protein